MRLIYVAFLLCIYSTVVAQSGTWTAFYNADSTLTGYKDNKGMVRIEPKFSGLSVASRFDNIIAVTEKSNDQWQSYYLTRSGRKVGRDSLFIFDNAADCESEGFIRFHDRKAGKTGLLNRNGDVVIPAGYDAMTRVNNGMLIVLKDAEKKYWDTTRHSDCNHYSWVGGTELLLDTAGNVLAENFRSGHDLDFFSVKKLSQPDADTTRASFRAKDGSYLSFINFKKEFSAWLKRDLFPGLTPERLMAAAYDTVTWWSPEGWIKTDKSAFIKNNFDVVKNGLWEILQPGADYFISIDGLNPFMYEGAGFEKYYDNCGEARQSIYPLMNIVVSHTIKKEIRQNHFSFLRTDDGYKLIEVTMRTGNLK